MLLKKRNHISPSTQAQLATTNSFQRPKKHGLFAHCSMENDDGAVSQDVPPAWLRCKTWFERRQRDKMLPWVSKIFKAKSRLEGKQDRNPHRNDDRNDRALLIFL